jgi:hypothetical protein
MSDTVWAKAVGTMKPYIFRIETPHSRGTGFQLTTSEDTGLCGIATALHVIQQAFEWEEPIRIEHYTSSKTLLLKPPERAIKVHTEMDLAFVVFDKEDLPLQQVSIPLIPEDTVLKQGIQTGWCGFPAMAPRDLCFFSGVISCYLHNENSYLVDGVAINGVSGGPSFYVNDEREVNLCGIVSEYRPNVASGVVLPGVCVFRAIGPYYQQIKAFRTLEEAMKKSMIASEAEKDTKKSQEDSTSQSDSS